MARVMAENAVAEAVGRLATASYQTHIDPPPGPPTDEQGNFIPMAHWDPAHWPTHIHKPRPVVVTLDSAETKPHRTAPPAFKRAVWAAEIVSQLHAEPTFGRVKFEKLLYLSEYHLGADFESNYQRAAAGPLDRGMLGSVEKIMRDSK